MWNYKTEQWNWKDAWVEKGDEDLSLTLTEKGMEKMMREIHNATISDVEVEGFIITLKTYRVGSGSPRKTWKFNLLDSTLVLEKRECIGLEDEDDEQ